MNLKEHSKMTLTKTKMNDYRSRSRLKKLTKQSNQETKIIEKQTKTRKKVRM